MIESKREGRKVRRNKEGMGKKTSFLCSARSLSVSLGRKDKKGEKGKTERRRKKEGRK
jgi:hypothetical protein